MPNPKIVIPDDYPPVLADRPAKPLHGSRLLNRCPAPRRLIERLRDAEIVSTSHIASSPGMFAACPGCGCFDLGHRHRQHRPCRRRAPRRHRNQHPWVRPSIAEHSSPDLASPPDPRTCQVRQGQWPGGSSPRCTAKRSASSASGYRKAVRRVGLGIGMRVIAWTMHPNPALGFELVELTSCCGRRCGQHPPAPPTRPTVPELTARNC
jgi:hypothetical protein